MLFVLSKILLFLIRPFIWAIILFIIAIFTGSSRKKKRLFLSSLFIILFFSNSFIVGSVLNIYEVKYPPMAKYDVGILLGGFSNVNKRNNSVQFGWAGDRLLQGVSLYKKGVINKILVTGGNSNLIDNKLKEADLTFNYLKQIGIPDSAILIENQSRNTLENASLSYKLIEKQKPKAKLLVITSAWHIPRAKVIFSKYFKNATYYPTNFLGKTEYDFSDYIVPSTEALSNWDLLFKEWIGILVDKFRG